MGGFEDLKMMNVQIIDNIVFKSDEDVFTIKSSNQI